MQCPIELSLFTNLGSLQIQAAGFYGCDFNDPTQVQLPPSLTTVDISDNEWLPMTLTVLSNHITLRANRANVVAIAIQPFFGMIGSSLQSISIDGSLFATQPVVAQQAQFAALLSTSGLVTLSCRNCSLHFSLAALLQSVKQVSQNLEVLRLSQVGRHSSRHNTSSNARTEHSRCFVALCVCVCRGLDSRTTSSEPIQPIYSAPKNRCCPMSSVCSQRFAKSTCLRTLA
jgi:hypothetical protein